MAQPLIPLRHRQFVNVRVLEHAGTARNGSLWLCRCSCGRLFTTLSSSLRRGATRSCGCLRTALLSLRASERNRKATP
jgi:hypothetical protein